MKIFDPKQLAEIVKNAQKGDNITFERAYQELYEKTWKYTYYLIVKRVGEGEMAYDLLQEVYIQVYLHLKTIDNPDAFMAWVEKIVITKHIDFVRKDKRHKKQEDYTNFIDVLAEENKDFLPEKSILRKEGHKELREIIKSLPDAQRTSIILFYFEEMSTIEIAKIMNVSENVIRKRLFDGRKAIKAKALELCKKSGTTSIFSLALLPLLPALAVDLMADMGIITSEIGKSSLKLILQEGVKNSATEVITKSGFFADKIIAPIADVIAKAGIAQTIAVSTITIAITTTGVYSVNNYLKEQNSQNANATFSENVALEPLLVAPLLVTPMQSEEIKLQPPATSPTNDKTNILLIPPQTETPVLASEQLFYDAPSENIVVVQSENSIEMVQSIVTSQATIKPEIEEVKVSQSPLPSPQPKQVIVKNVKLKINVDEKLESEQILNRILSESSNAINRDNAIFAYKIEQIYENPKNFLAIVDDLKGEIQIHAQIEFIDSAPPTIELENERLIYKKDIIATEQQIIKDANVIISDNFDKSPKVIITNFSKIDFTTVGENWIEINAIDQDGNSSPKQIIIIEITN